MAESTSLRVLVVDNEHSIRRMLRLALEATYTVMETETGQDALQMVAVNHPDLVVLDLDLPDMNGMEVIQRLREWTMVPIIVISVRDRDVEKAAALDTGADDYMTKPFSVVELLARIRTALRHSVQPIHEAYYQDDDLIINLARRQVLVNNQQVMLTPTQYEILRVLVNHAGKVLTHQQLIRAVWGDDNDADSHLLRVNISNLRHKIERDPFQPCHVITEPGVGYRLREVEEYK